MPSSEASPLVQTDLSDGLLTVTLNRPERRNALDPAMHDALAVAAAREKRDPEFAGR